MHSTWWGTEDGRATRPWLQETVRAFAQDSLVPTGAALDQMATPEQVIAPESPLWSVFTSAHAKRLDGALVLEQDGGLGLAGPELYVVAEELGAGSVDLAASVLMNGIPWWLLLALGRHDLVKEVVRPRDDARGRARVTALALTEPHHGWPQLAVGAHEFQVPKVAWELAAVRDGDDYVLTGGKSAWVTHGSIASTALVSLTVEPRRGMAGNALAVVPLDLPGVTRGRPVDKWGQRGMNQGEIHFDNVRIPRRFVVAAPEDYAPTLSRLMTLIWTLAGAIYTGLARAAWEHAQKDLEGRTQDGGNPLAEHPRVRERLFEMATLVECSRALCRSVMVSAERPSLNRAAQVKIHASHAAEFVADEALTLSGARGMQASSRAGKLFRDARVTRVQFGPNDVIWQAT
ncbi:MAG: acyl-CoA dehydrogenase family protein [Myxococcota bacterium]